jgi:hypothetical protein
MSEFINISLSPKSLKREKSVFAALLLLLIFSVSNISAQKPSGGGQIYGTLAEVPVALNKRARQFVEDMRYESAAARWKDARLDTKVIKLYRPDLDDVAFYEFSLINSRGEKVGYVTLSNGEHEQPVAGWADEGISPGEQLIREAEGNGAVPARVYKLNEVTYVVEDASGQVVSQNGSLPLKIVGQRLEWLDQNVEPTTIESFTNVQDGSDESGSIPEQQVKVTGDTESHFTLEPWASWQELKAGYAESYAVMNEWTRRTAAFDWKVERALTENGEALFADEVASFAAASENILSVRVIRGNPNLIKAEITPREAISPVIKVASNTPPQEEMPFEILVDYGTTTDLIKVTILPESYRERIGGGGGKTVNGKVLKDDSIFDERGGGQSKWYGFGTGSWGAWYTSWAAHHNDQRWYDQIAAHTSTNTSNCWSGCGATAWAMLFGWGDHRAWEHDPTWDGRFGLYRANGGYGADAHAPSFQWMDPGVDNMIWEIRRDILTFCAFGQGATYPATMWGAALYLNNRTYATLSTSYNGLGFGLPWLRDAARNSIVNRDVPVILGTGFFSHYPLAYGYQVRSRKINLGFWQLTDYDHEFYVNMGWGSSTPGYGRKWIAGHTWFAGQLYPNLPTQTKKLIAKHSNKCLDVNGAGYGDGTNVIQWTCHGGANQQWRLEPVQTVGNYYRILAHHSGKALDVSGISTATGANVHQWEWWMGDNQLWELIPQGGGYYLVKAKHSGKCLDVSGVSTADGANVYQWDCHGGGNQLWRITP